VPLHPDEPLERVLRRRYAQRLGDMSLVDGDGRFLGMVSLAQLASRCRTAGEGIEKKRHSEHSLDAELVARARGSTTEHAERAQTLAD
jgi:hypothetical protein